MKSRVLEAGLLLSLLSSAARAHASEENAGPCPIRGKEPCVLTLQGPGAPRASAACSTDAWSSRLKFPMPSRWSDSNGDGWWESVLEVRLDPAKDCGCARFKVTYDEPVSGWTVDVGNSPTNNGHGGDEGTTPNAAEVQIVKRQLSVFTASRPVPHRVDRLLDETLPSLGGRTIELQICEQALEVTMLPAPGDPSPPKWKLQTLNAKLLFSLEPQTYRSDTPQFPAAASSCQPNLLGPSATDVDTPLPNRVFYYLATATIPSHDGPVEGTLGYAGVNGAETTERPNLNSCTP